MKNNVRTYRVKHGLTQEQLSLLSGVGRSTISNIETQRYIPRVDVAIYIARALHVPVERLFVLEMKERWEKMKRT